MRDVRNFCALWDDRSNNGGGKVVIKLGKAFCLGHLPRQ